MSFEGSIVDVELLQPASKRAFKATPSLSSFANKQKTCELWARFNPIPSMVLESLLTLGSQLG